MESSMGFFVNDKVDKLPFLNARVLNDVHASLVSVTGKDEEVVGGHGVTLKYKYKVNKYIHTRTHGFT